MTISIGQLFIIVLLSVLLFGNFPNILRDIRRGLNFLLKNTERSNATSEHLDKKQEKRDLNP